MNTIKERLVKVKDLIHQTEKKYGREPKSVKFLAASKGQKLSGMIELIEVGQKLFGENYVDEALIKMKSINHDDIEWHFIGRIQTNKTKLISEHFDWVHSLCSLKHAKRLNEQRPLEKGCLNICIQLNIDEEENKAGLLISEIDDFLKKLTTFDRLSLRGLMVIPKKENDFEKQRETYRKVFNLQKKLIDKGYRFDTLSMGMSGDFIAAIAEGATIVRIGEAIFGPRER